VILAYNQDKIEIHSEIWIRMKEDNMLRQSIGNLIQTVDLDNETTIEYYQDRQIRKTKTGEVIVQYIRTTTGRAILNYIIQKTLNFL
jgi:DNA-directed RNA polymerase subunit beta'